MGLHHLTTPVSPHTHPTDLFVLPLKIFKTVAHADLKSACVENTRLQLFGINCHWIFASLSFFKVQTKHTSSAIISLSICMYWTMLNVCSQHWIKGRWTSGFVHRLPGFMVGWMFERCCMYAQFLSVVLVFMFIFMYLGCAAPWAGHFFSQCYKSKLVFYAQSCYKRVIMIKRWNLKGFLILFVMLLLISVPLPCMSHSKPRCPAASFQTLS